MNSCLIFVLLQKLGHKRELSFLFALLFTCHPVLVSAVVWLPGRTDTLLGLFTIISFLTLIKFIDTKSPLNFIIHGIAFILALLTKETAIVLPIVFFYLFNSNKKKNHNIEKDFNVLCIVGKYYCAMACDPK